MPQLLVLVRVGGPQLKYDYFGGRGLKRLRSTAVNKQCSAVCSSQLMMATRPFHEASGDGSIIADA